MNRSFVRGLMIGAGAFVAFGCIVFAGASCYVAAKMDAAAFNVRHGPSDHPLLVESLTDDTVVLEGHGLDTDGDWNRDGVFGLEGDHGYGRVGSVLSRGNGTVTREFHLQLGTFSPGDRARIEGFTWRGSPAESLGMDSESIAFDSELGQLQGWFVPATGDDWVIFIHGKGASPDEALRILPTVHEAGFPALGITYRNDVGAPADPSGRYGYGSTEWKDAEAAIDYATSHGARSVVLYGYSMGAAIALATLRDSDLATNVEALVLDSPMLDLKSVIRHQAAGKSLPGLLTSAAMWTAGMRHDIDWESLDYMADGAALDKPTLILHGDADPDVPVGDSRELASQNAEHVRLVEFTGAGHVRSWNLHREEYEATVAQFLGGLASSD